MTPYTSGSGLDPTEVEIVERGWWEVDDDGTEWSDPAPPDLVDAYEAGILTWDGKQFEAGDLSWA